MVESRYTSGPWTYNEKSANRVTGPEGVTIAATYGGIVGTEEQVYNTRLIANAPAMFEYILNRAAEGDKQAKQIIADIEASTE